MSTKIIFRLTQPFCFPLFWEGDFCYKYEINTKIPSIFKDIQNDSPFRGKEDFPNVHLTTPVLNKEKKTIQSF